jgi:hypothetical protein
MIGMLFAPSAYKNVRPHVIAVTLFAGAASASWIGWICSAWIESSRVADAIRRALRTRGMILDPKDASDRAEHRFKESLPRRGYLVHSPDGGCSARSRGGSLWRACLRSTNPSKRR